MDYLACHPTVGDLIPGTGGVRKLRWSLEGRGKRGGTWVVYFYHDPGVPVFGNDRGGGLGLVAVRRKSVRSA
ncbi:MAG: hypothetical protein EXR27_20145 [Betaproteobacteria bacterium]|nr:hypothetical protein [Betaproteobacteria bacterium]